MHFRGTAAALFAATVTVTASSPVSIAQAQGRPNFSGVWSGTFVSQSGRDPVVSPVFADSPVTITQVESSLTLAYVSKGRSHRRVLLTYKFDGSEITRTDAFSTVLQNVVSSAVWENETLVITTRAERSVTTGSIRAMVSYVFRDRLTLESPTTFRLDSSRAGNGTEVTRVSRWRRTEPPRN
jgi:hypothetical protein